MPCAYSYRDLPVMSSSDLGGSHKLVRTRARAGAGADDDCDNDCDNGDEEGEGEGVKSMTVPDRVLRAT